MGFDKGYIVQSLYILTLSVVLGEERYGMGWAGLGKKKMVFGLTISVFQDLRGCFIYKSVCW
ncbi:MAG: hypothetical protein H6P94_855 [Thermoplasmatales archaeon]|jgi:hypothetical protein|nr:hypothetical protein [Thermoplasmatales archaeon]